MRLISILAAVAVLGAAQAMSTPDTAGQQLTVVRNGFPHDALFDIEIEGKTGLAVGSFGALLSTADGGATWRSEDDLGEIALTALALSAERSLVVGQRGAIFLGGESGGFTSVDSGTTERLLGVDLHQSGLAVAVGGFGTLLVSADSGQSWRQAVLDWPNLNEEGLEAHLYDVVINDDGEIFGVGEFGLVLRSRDRGQNWEALTSGAASLFALHMGGNGKAFAVGQNGTVLRSTDGGDSWVTLDAGPRANLLDVWASPDDEVVIVGMRALLRSSDGGESWTAAGGRGVERTWYQALATGIVTRTSDNVELHEERVYAAGQMGRIVTINN